MEVEAVRAITLKTPCEVTAKTGRYGCKSLSITFRFMNGIPA